MGTLIDPKSAARRKGWLTLAAWGGTGALIAASVTWPLCVAGGVAAGWLTLDWLRFRGRWGLRF